ncbi:hypothetical protein K501DRAFT_328094 [Backusella circina FSU 941]|nr:hypothetical protein K501DRAFT_328094 [Backusella circina FSU 941]
MSNKKKALLYIQPRTLFIFIAFSFLLGRYSNVNTGIKQDATIKLQQEEPCVVWLRHKMKADMIKVTLTSCHKSVWADVKLDAQKQLNLPISTAPDMWLLHPTMGRLKANQPVQNMTQLDKPILIYIDNFDSRLALKKRVSLPINLSESLCLIEFENGKHDNTAYQALYDVLYDNNFTTKQTQALRKRLCGSSTQGSHTFCVS